MTDRHEKHTRHFQIGVVPISLYTTLRGVRNRYTSMNRAFQVEKRPHRAIQVEVRAQPLVLWRRRRYDVMVNQQLRYQPDRSDAVLPYIDWAINLEVPQVMPEYLQLHASSMEVDGTGVIFPAHSGSGKSTLTAGLVTRGWRYLCDEFALIHADTLQLHPYPRPICIKRPSYPVIESLGLKLHANRHYVKGSKGPVGFVSPADLGPDAVGKACPIRYVIFPKYTAGVEPTLIPINRAEAAFALHKVCFNLLGCQALGLDVLAQMIRGAVCYRLIASEIQSTCDLLQRLVRGGQHQHARSA